MQFYFKFVMAVNYTYYGKFNSKVLIVGQTGRQKTMFTQNLAKNKLFGKLKNVFWLTKIELSKDREQNIATSFHGIPLRFLYPWTSDDFNMHLDFFSKGKMIKCNGWKKYI